VRHVRDGLSWNTEHAYTAFNKLADRGIGVDFIMGDPTERNDTLDQLLTVLRARVLRTADAVEGPNEYSRSGDPLWAARLRAYQGRLYSAVKGDPALQRLPVLAPSLISWQDYAELGDLRTALDAGNKHSYPGGDMPELNVVQELADAARVSGDRPVWVTESGYHNALATDSGHRPASEAAAATYLPRMFLEYFRRGVPRTYSYELIDLWPDPARRDLEANFGLLRNDYTEKPAFRRLANLIAVLSDPGPAHPVKPLDLTVAAGPSELRRLLLQKRDGSYDLVLWRVARVWDPVARQPLSSRAETVAVRLAPAAASGFAGADLIDPAVSPKPYASSSSVGDLRVTVGPDPVVVRFAPRAQDSTTATTPGQVRDRSGRVGSNPRIVVGRRQSARKVLSRGLLVRCWAPGGSTCSARAGRDGALVASGSRAVGISGKARVLARATRRGRRVLRRALRRGRAVSLVVRAAAGDGRTVARRVTVRP
jgi:hypothetical protein